jgi:hypothetical protein
MFVESGMRGVLENSKTERIARGCVDIQDDCTPANIMPLA